MKAYVNRKEVGHRLLISLLAFIAPFALSMQPALYAEQQQTPSGGTQVSSSAAVVEEPDGKTAGSPETAPAMRVYIDPQTGKIGEPPPGVPPTEVPSPLKEALSTSSEGLEVTPSPVPGGGVMIDLKGRFQSPLTATRDAEGKLTIQHQPKEPDSTKNE